MKYYLYTFRDNWADEMDLEGFAVLTQSQKDSALAGIRKEFKRGGIIGFGTNEENEYDSLKDVMECIEFKKISHTEYETIKKLFDDGKMGELGPLSSYDIEDFDDDERECENCGCSLEDGDDLCEDCAEEDIFNQCEDCAEEDIFNQKDLYNKTVELFYNKRAKYIVDLIKKEYGLIETSDDSHYYSKFIWKPTPKTEIEITIYNFDNGDEKIDFALRLGRQQLDYQFFKLRKAYDNPSRYVKETIKKLIEKAKKY